MCEKVVSIVPQFTLETLYKEGFLKLRGFTLFVRVFVKRTFNEFSLYMRNWLCLPLKSLAGCFFFKK